MTTEDHRKTDFDPDDPRLSAYVLDELAADEKAAIEELLDRSPAARELVDELRVTTELLHRELASEAEGGVRLDSQRAAVLRESLQGSATPRRARSWLAIGIGLAAAGFVGWFGLGLLAETWFADPEPDGEISVRAWTSDSSSRSYVLEGEQLARPERERTMDRLRSLGYIQPENSPAPTSVTASAQPADGRAQLLAPVVDMPGLASESTVSKRTNDELPDLGNTESYAHIRENDFRRVSEEPLSTFSIDVDTASYTNVRRYLQRGMLPPKDAVRIEELVNYFTYDDPAPEGDVPFEVSLEVAQAPWQLEHRLLRIGLKGREIPREERAASNLVFLLDVSGSMNSPDKLQLIQRGLRLLVEALGENDRVAIVVYASATGMVLPSTSCDNKETIFSALERLSAGGSTNGGAGIQLAYDVAVNNFIPGGTNRVILCTDGDFNVGVSDNGSLTRLIEEKAKSGVFLSVLGFGSGNLKDDKMEQLADRGNGNYAYIDSIAEAEKVLVREMGSTLITIAKDVKLQLEFNPLQIAAYRLIGYENRLLANQDFADDTKDAGEIGAGHSVVALYELIPAGQEVPAPDKSERRYVQSPEVTPAARSAEILNAKLRYKLPDEDHSRLISFPLEDAKLSFDEASENLRFAASVAAFGMVLRDSKYKGSANFAMAQELAGDALGRDSYGDRGAFLDLIAKAMTLR